MKKEFCECRNPTKIIKWKYPFCVKCRKFIKVLRTSPIKTNNEEGASK